MACLNYSRISALWLLTAAGIAAAAAPFKVFMIASPSGDHRVSSLAAKAAMIKMGQANNFSVDFTTDTSIINDATLAPYRVFFQMHLAPFEFSLNAQKALEKFIAQKKGWVGVHAAGLVQPDWQPANVPYWKWYEGFFGGVKYVTHPEPQIGNLIVEDRAHPATRNLPATFRILDDFYEFSGSPRGKVHVLISADEKSYTPVKPMGDHPLIWTNPDFARMIYIGVGRDSSVWSNTDYYNLVRDAVLWAATSDSAAAGLDAPIRRPSKPALSASGTGTGALLFPWARSRHAATSLWDTRGHESGTLPGSPGWNHP